MPKSTIHKMTIVLNCLTVLASLVLLVMVLGRPS